MNVLNHISVCFLRILSNAGEVLAYSGKDEKKFVDVVSAITNNMWLVLQNSGEAALNEDYLDYVLIQCTVSFSYANILVYIFNATHSLFSFRKEKLLLEKWLNFCCVFVPKDSLAVGFLKRNHRY